MVALLTLFLVLFVAQSSATPISFGNAESTLSVGADGAFYVGNPSGMLVQRGRLAAEPHGLLTGKPIRFDRAILGTSDANHLLNGLFRPAPNLFSPGAGVVEVGANPNPQELDLVIPSPEGFAHRCLIRPGGVLLRGQPQFAGTNDLVLQDDNTLLAIAAQNALTSNIILNGGVLLLQDSLRLSDKVVLRGNGQIVFNSRRIAIGGGEVSFRGTKIWNNAQDIQLNSRVNVDGIWVFFGNGQINGNGNVLDISNGGIIAVLPGSSLSLSDVVLVGVGTGGFLLADDAVVVLSGVTVEMDNSFNLASGTVVVAGDTNLITRDHFFNVSGQGKLIVDRVALTYDTLDFDDQFNIRPLRIQDPAQQFIRIVNNGSIRRFRTNPISFLSYSSTTLLDRYAHVYPGNPITIFPEPDPITGYPSSTVTIDGGTNFLAFSRSDSPLLFITQGVQARYTNMVFRGFSPKHLALEAGAELVFDDGCWIELSRDEELNMTWPIEGHVVLRGNGNTLTLGQNGKLLLRGPRAKLELQNIEIKGLQEDSIVCTDDTGILSLENVSWIQKDQFTFARGGIQVKGPWILTGPQLFLYTSVQPFQFLPHGSLTFYRGATFGYQPTDGNRELIQADQTNDLIFDQAGLFAPAPGLLLRNLRLTLRYRNTLNNPGGTNSGSGVQIDSSVTVVAGATDVFEVEEGVLSD